MSEAIELDGRRVRVAPQDYSWEPPSFLGDDGDGAPSYAPFWSFRLSFSLTQRAQLEQWYDAMDGDTHTVRLPHPITQQWTDFADVFIRLPALTGTIIDPNRPAATGIDFMVTRVDIS